MAPQPSAPYPPPLVIPPYVAFPLLKDLLRALSKIELPTSIEVVLRREFSTSNIRQLQVAIRFFAFADYKGDTTEAAAILARSVDTTAWPAALADVLHEKYTPLLAPDLATATPDQFAARFAAHYAAKGDTLRKAVSFFVAAAAEARLPISPDLFRNRKPRRQSGSAGDGGILPGGLSGSAAPRPEADEPLDAAFRAWHPLIVEQFRLLPAPSDGEWSPAERLIWFRGLATNVMQVYDRKRKPVELMIALAPESREEAER